MSVLDHISSAHGLRDQTPNKILARRIIQENGLASIKELIDNLDHKTKTIQGDCIKVLDEIAEERPDLVASYSEDLLKVLHSKNNRMIWGTMATLDNICLEKPDEFFTVLPEIMAALDNASVITRDHGVKILVKLSSYPDYYNTTWPLYLEQLQNAPENQFPSYAEWGSTIVQQKDKSQLTDIITKHIAGIDQASKISRLNKVLKSLQKKS